MSDEIWKQHREMEERLLRHTDKLHDQGADAFSLHMADQHIREAFMWMTRAAYNDAKRIELPEDKAAAEANPMPPIYVGDVFSQYHEEYKRTVTTDERGNELEAVGPHWYDKNELERWRNPEAVPTPPIPPGEAEETTSSSD